jgi:rubrerythrin
LINNSIDTRKFLNTCETIEKTIGKIYRQFVASTLCDEELKAIWIKMAEEEDQHATDIGFAARLPHEGTFKVKDLTQSRVDQLLDLTKKVLNKAMTSEISTETAVDLTLKLEKEFLAVHIASSLEFEKANMRQMFQSIVQSEEAHYRDIRSYHAKYFNH